jgi:hypothetical protein
MGRVRDDLAEGLRSFPVGHYVIFYTRSLKAWKSSACFTVRGTLTPFSNRMPDPSPAFFLPDFWRFLVTPCPLPAAPLILRPLLVVYKVNILLYNALKWCVAGFTACRHLSRPDKSSFDAACSKAQILSPIPGFMAVSELNC